MEETVVMPANAPDFSLLSLRSYEADADLGLQGSVMNSAAAELLQSCLRRLICQERHGSWWRRKGIEQGSKREEVPSDLTPLRFEKARDDMQFSGWLSNQAGKKLRFCSVSLREGPVGDHLMGGSLMVSYFYENKKDGAGHDLHDFIGLYEVDRVEDDKDRDVGRIAIKYVPRSNSGDLNFTETALRPGLYEFRWYLSGTCLAAVSRTFKAVLPDISLTAPRLHQCGTHLDIAYEIKMPTRHHDSDWISLRAVAQKGEDLSSKGYRDDGEVLRINLPGANLGSIRILTHPRFPGVYTLSYHLGAHRGVAAAISKPFRALIPVQVHPSVSREIRLFVSGTCIDMVHERAHLEASVFPALQEHCNSLGGVLTIVDVRDGCSTTTDGSTISPTSDSLPGIEMRLAEIEKCRPYFLCLLGQRYGHVPSSHPASAVEKYPWLQNYRNQEVPVGVKASLTELDIAAALFVAPDMADRAVILMRKKGLKAMRLDDKETLHLCDKGDTLYVPGAFCENPGDITAQVAERAMTDLRGRIIALNRGNVIEYTSLSGAGNTMCSQAMCSLKASVSMDLGSRPGNLSRSLMHSHILATETLRSCEGSWIERGDALAQLSAYLQGPATGTMMVVTGPAGCGKSALLAKARENLIEDRTLDQRGVGMPCLALYEDKDEDEDEDEDAVVGVGQAGVASTRSTCMESKASDETDLASTQAHDFESGSFDKFGSFTPAKEEEFRNLRLVYHQVIATKSLTLPLVLRHVMKVTGDLLGFSSLSLPVRDSDMEGMIEAWLEGMKMVALDRNCHLSWIVDGLENLEPDTFIERLGQLQSDPDSNGLPCKKDAEMNFASDPDMFSQIALARFCSRAAESGPVAVSLNHFLRVNLPSTVVSRCRIIQLPSMTQSERQQMLWSMLKLRRLPLHLAATLQSARNDAFEQKPETDWPEPLLAKCIVSAIASLSSAHTSLSPDRLTLVDLVSNSRCRMQMADYLLRLACKLHPKAAEVLCLVALSSTGLTQLQLSHLIYCTPVMPCGFDDTNAGQTRAVADHRHQHAAGGGATDSASMMKKQASGSGGVILGLTNDGCDPSPMHDSWILLRTISALEDFGVLFRLHGMLHVAPMFRNALIEHYTSDVNHYTLALQRLCCYFVGPQVQPESEHKIQEVPVLLLRTQQLRRWAEKLEGHKAEVAAIGTAWIQHLDAHRLVHELLYDVNQFHRIESGVAVGLIRVFGMDESDLLGKLKRRGEEDQGLITHDVLEIEDEIRNIEAEIRRLGKLRENPGSFYSDFSKHKFFSELDAEELGVKETLDVAQRKLYILRKSLKPARPKEWSLTALSVARLAEGLGNMSNAEEMLAISLQTSYDVTHLSRIAVVRPRRNFENLASHALNLYADILAQPPFPDNGSGKLAFLSKLELLDDAVRNIENVIGAVGVLRFDIRTQLKECMHMARESKFASSSDWYRSRSFKKPHLPKIRGIVPEMQVNDEPRRMWQAGDEKDEFEYKREERRTHEWLKECGFQSWVFKDLDQKEPSKAVKQQRIHHYPGAKARAGAIRAAGANHDIRNVSDSGKTIKPTVAQQRKFGKMVLPTTNAATANRTGSLPRKANAGQSGRATVASRSRFKQGFVASDERTTGTGTGPDASATTTKTTTTTLLPPIRTRSI